MAFYSILYPSLEEESRARRHPWLDYRWKARKREEAYITRGNKIMAAGGAVQEDAPKYPGLYLDLNMDRIMASVLCQESDGDLAEVFYHFCPGTAMALYRHEVMRMLEQEETYCAFRTFFLSMHKADQLLAYGRQAHHPAQRDKYAVDGAALYCEAVRRLLKEAGSLPISSAGLKGFLDALDAYVREEGFLRLETAVRSAKEKVESIRYGLRIEQGCVYVDFDRDGADYGQAFERDLRPADSPEAGQEERPGIRLFRQAELSPLEALIMNALAKRHVQTFRELNQAAALASAVPEETVGRFVKEIRFYFRSLDLMKRLRAEGFSFAYPEFSGSGEIAVRGAYDLALAITTPAVVPNDFTLSAEERGVIVTGANQGGKTTFARSIGQIAVLAALGLPVPCEYASIKLYDGIFSQFSEPEDITAQNGKLKEELLRLKPILRMAGRDSLVILNELFSSATVQDGMDMAEITLSRLTAVFSHIVFVTHIDALVSPGMVSMVAKVGEKDGERLYRIERAPADGRAYAASIAAKYHLTSGEIRGRISHGV